MQRVGHDLSTTQQQYASTWEKEIRDVQLSRCYHPRKDVKVLAVVALRLGKGENVDPRTD